MAINTSPSWSSACLLGNLSTSKEPLLLVLDAEQACPGTELRPGKPELRDQDQRLQLSSLKRALHAHSIGVPRRVSLEIGERARLGVCGLESKQSAFRLRFERRSRIR